MDKIIKMKPTIKDGACMLVQDGTHYPLSPEFESTHSNLFYYFHGKLRGIRKYHEGYVGEELIEGKDFLLKHNTIYNI